MLNAKALLRSRIRVVALFAVLFLASASVPVLAADPPLEQEAPAGNETEAAVSPPGEAQITEAIEAFERSEAEHEAELQTPQSIAERVQSRSTFRGLTPEEAKALLLETFSTQLAKLDAEPARSLADVKVEKVFDQTAATISEDGHGYLLEAGIPIRTEDDEGDLSKVDLDLERTEEGFQPENPLTEVAIPESAGDPISIGEEGLAVTAVGAEGAARPFDEQAVYYPEAQTDTDLLVAPTGFGVEVFDQLRSIESPEDLHFQLDLPSGSSLQMNGGGVDVVEDGETVAMVSPPTAIDAQGTQIPLQMTVEGTTVTIEVPHREGDYAYPILVDPAITEDFTPTYGQSWYGGANLDALPQWGVKGSDETQKYILRSTYCLNVKLCSTSGRSLFLSFIGGYYPKNLWTEWYWNVPGETTYIPGLYPEPSTVFWPYFRNDNNCGDLSKYPLPYDFEGQYDANGNWTYIDLNKAHELYYGAYGNGKGIAFGLGTGPNEGTNPCWRDLLVGGVAVRLDDPEAPTLYTPTGFPSGWISGAATFTVTASMMDPGLGVRNVVVYPSGRPQVPYVSPGSECPGTKLHPCPRNVTAQFNLGSASFDEGEKKVEVSGYDPTGEVSGTYTTMMKVDRTPPQVIVAEEFAEATHETEGDAKDPKKWDQLSLPVYNLKVEATDGSLASGEAKRSGVKSIELQMDGKKLEAWTQACPGSSCPMTQSYPVQLNDLSADTHHVLKVIVKDQVENEYKREIEFEYEPATGIKDEFVLQHFPLPDGKDHSEEEVYQGPELAVNVMNGNVVYHERDVDIEGPNVDLETDRYYNSQQPAEADGQWGEGWSLAQTPDLGISGSEGALLAPTGVLEGEVELPTGVSEGHFDPELQALVTKEPGGGYSVADEGGKGDRTMVFDASGKTTEMQTSGPATVDYSYEGGDLSELAVEDPNSSSETPPIPPEVPAVGAAPTYSSVFGALGSGNGQLSHPVDAARDAAGNLWVLDQGNNRVEQFNSKGEYVSKFGSTGSATGQFNRPTAIAISTKGSIFVADAGNSRVQVFNSKGEYVSKFGAAGTGNGQFTSPGPEGIAVDAKGNVWVSDTYGGRLEKFSEAGSFVKAVASKGSGSGQLGEPVGLDVAPDGSVWVADWLNNRVSVFDEGGAFVRQFGSAGSGNGQFRRPGSVTVDGRGVAWVADQESSRIEGFNAKGEYLTQFGAGGSGNGQFGYPSAIVTDAEGHLWVIDAAKRDIRTSSSGSPLIWPSAAYAFDEGSGTTAKDSAGAHTGTVTSPSWVEGKYGKALSFNGESSCVSVPNSIDLQLAGSFTLEASVKPNNTTQWAPIFFKESESFYSYSLFFGAFEAGHVQGYVAEKPWEQWAEVESPGKLTANTWAHVAMTSDATTLRLYVNGTQVDTASAKAVTESKQPLYIGCWKSQGEYFNGTIDNARIYNRALSAAEVEANKALAISTTPDGNRVQKWTIASYVPDYTPAASSSFGSLGSGNGQVNGPADIASDPATGNVWVADANNNRIEKFNSSGTYLAKFGSLGTGNGQFNHPSAVALDPEGNLWVADTNNNRIQKFNPSGTYVTKFGSAGAGNGQFSAPEGIAIGPEGSIWVADTKNARLQVFKPNGEFVKAIGVKGSGTGQLLEPTGLAFGPSEHLFVADWGNNRISEFTAEGQFVASFGSEGSGAGQLQHPSGVDLDDKGVVWVADAGNGRVELFDEAGGFITQLGSKGSGTGQFSLERAAGIATAASGWTWIADTKNNRVQKWVTPAYQAEEEATEILEEPNDPTAEINVSSGLVTSVDAGPENENTYSYSGDDLVSHTGPEGQTKFESDAEGHITKITLPNGTTATIKYEAVYHRATSVTVDPAGAPPAKTTKFNYQTNPRRTIVEPEDAPYVNYFFGLDGSVLKSSTVAQPPEIILSGNLFEKKESSEAIKTGLYDLEVLANSDQGIASIKVIASNTVVVEKSCAQTEAPGIECQHESEEWVVETGQLPPGIMQVEVLVEDRLHAISNQRFWVNVPYTPPPPADAPLKPTFSEVKRFRQEFGLDRDLNPATEQQQINNRIYDLLNAWNNPQTPEGQVARSSAERWGVPLRPVDVAEMEYREWYVEQDGPLIESWGYSHYPGSYGGYEVDHAAGGIIRIGFTEAQTARVAQFIGETNPAAADRIESAVTPPARARISVENLEGEVLNYANLDSKLEPLVTEVSIAPSGGSVTVGATDVTAAKSRLTELFGSLSGIEVVFRPYPSEPQADRFRGSGRIIAGEWIALDWTPGKPTPTWGFETAGFGAWEKEWVDQEKKWIKARFLLSAGHGAPNNSTAYRLGTPGVDPSKIRGSEERFGRVERDPYFEGSEAIDALAIRLSGLAPLRIFGRDGNQPPVGPADQAHIGELLCISGAATNRPTCGQVIAFGHPTGQGHPRIGMVAVDGLKTENGDSGAPIWNPRTGRSVGIFHGRVHKGEGEAGRRYVQPLLTTKIGHERYIPGALHAALMGDLNIITGP